MKGLVITILLLLCGLSSAPASATGFTDIGQDIATNQDELEIKLEGFLRLRGMFFYNLDLDRGPTPSGELFFPVPLADPTSQTLTHADFKLRNDLSIYSPVGAFAIKLRVDIFDNYTLGSDPDSIPTLTTSQRPPESSFLVRRAYAEMLLPFGFLALGRMGAHWGLGMLVNGGDNSDSDSGDSADRIAFLTPILSHVWAISYDFSSTGPITQRRGGDRSLDIEPTDDLSSFTFAVMNFRTDLSRERRRKAGKTTAEYGAYISYRWQSNDIPGDYLPTAVEVPVDRTQIMARDFSATAVDVWFKLTLPSAWFAFEVAVMWATIEQASVIPGVFLEDPVTSMQAGAVFESMIGAPEDPVAGGLDIGLASGDDGYGFGAFPELNSSTPQPGDLDGPQANPPFDNTVNNFRFHTDYHIDRILFREIIGTVTDAFYLRPHIQARLARIGRATLTLSLNGVVSWTLNKNSAPGGEHPLGIELDPTLVYDGGDGFTISLEYAVLFPLAGLDNPLSELSASPAQLGRIRLTYGF